MRLAFRDGRTSIEVAEVWGAGVTYRPSADFRDADMEAKSGIRRPRGSAFSWFD